MVYYSAALLIRSFTRNRSFKLKGAWGNTCGTIRIVDLEEIEQVHGNFKRQYEEDALASSLQGNADVRGGVHSVSLLSFFDNEPGAG